MTSSPHSHSSPPDRPLPTGRVGKHRRPSAPGLRMCNAGRGSQSSTNLIGQRQPADGKHRSATLSSAPHKRVLLLWRQWRRHAGRRGLRGGAGRSRRAGAAAGASADPALPARPECDDRPVPCVPAPAPDTTWRWALDPGWRTPASAAVPPHANAAPGVVMVVVVVVVVVQATGWCWSLRCCLCRSATRSRSPRWIGSGPPCRKVRIPSRSTGPPPFCPGREVARGPPCVWGVVFSMQHLPPAL